MEDKMLETFIAGIGASCAREARRQGAVGEWPADSALQSGDMDYLADELRRTPTDEEIAVFERAFRDWLAEF